jgi:hypothetical protein
MASTLAPPHGTIQRMQELHNSVMVIVWQHSHIGTHIVHNHNEALKHGVNGLTGHMSEILILHPVGREQASLHLIVPTMSYLELLPNLARQVLCLNPIKFRFAKGTEEIISGLVVGLMHISRAWGKEADGVDIGGVLCHIPNDLSFATKKSRHTSLPHLVIHTIKVRRTRPPFLVCHLWT